MELQNLNDDKKPSLSPRSRSFTFCQLYSISLFLCHSQKFTRNEPFKFNKLILRAIAERKLDVNAKKIGQNLYFSFLKKCTLWIHSALKSLCLKSFLIFLLLFSFTPNCLSAIMTTWMAFLWSVEHLVHIKACSRITFTQQQTTKNLFNLFSKAFSSELH